MYKENKSILYLSEPKSLHQIYKLSFELVVNMSQLEIVHVCQFLELESKVYFSTQLKRKTSALKNKEGLCENKPKDIPLTAGQARVSNPWLDPRASTYI